MDCVEIPEVDEWLRHRRMTGLTCLIIGVATAIRMSQLQSQIGRIIPSTVPDERSLTTVVILAWIAVSLWIFQMLLMIIDIRKFPFGFVSTAALIAYGYGHW